MEDFFREAFYDKAFNSQGFYKFIEFLRTKDANHRYSVQQIKEFYERQPVIQRMRIKRARNVWNRIFTLEPKSILYMDSMFITDDKLALIVAIDLYSKKLYLKYIKTRKSRGGLDKGQSVKAVDTRKFLDEIMDQTEYKEIRTDGGSEFQDEFKRKYGDKLKQFVDMSKRLLSPVERVNRSIRNLYEKKKLGEGKPTSVPDFKRFIQEIEDAYNNSVHRTIRTTPNDAFQNPEKVLNIYQNFLLQTVKNKKNPLPVGAKVRLYQPPRKRFNKLKPLWSEKIYIIGTDTFDTELNRYRFNNKLYDPEDVQQVSADTVIPVEEEPQPRSARPNQPRQAPPREPSKRIRRAPSRFVR